MDCHLDLWNFCVQVGNFEVAEVEPGISMKFEVILLNFSDIFLNFEVKSSKA
jgi:hypothetical protein